MVNEEYIYANDYQTNNILKIDVNTGFTESIDFSQLFKQQKEFIESTNEASYDWGNNVLNGIAYNKEKQTFLVTGKMWDFAYEVKIF